MSDTPLLTILALAAYLRKRLLRSVAPSSFPSLGSMLANMIPGEEILARTFRDGQLLGFLDGSTELVKAIPAAKTPASPPVLARALPAHFELEFPGIGSRPPEPPPPIFPERPGDPAPVARFPAIEKAGQYLKDRIAFTPAEFRMLDDEARAVGFTVAKTMSLDAVEKVRDALADEVMQGTSLKAFRGRIADVIEESALAPHHVEAIYRTHTARAMAYGQLSVIDHPLISDQFPYGMYAAVHDGRTRATHLALESLGMRLIDGSRGSIYRIEDPVLRRYWGPWDWNCFLPGTVVQGRFNLAIKSWYAGEAVEIVTRKGYRLTVTANHPILTPQGFVAAKSIRQSDRLLSYRGGVEGEFAKFPASRAVMGDRHSDAGEKYAPAPVEKVFDSLANLFPVRTLPCGVDDLHGEAKFGNGRVDVVGSDIVLPSDHQPPRFHCGDNLIFAGMNVQRSNRAGSRFPDLRLKTPFAASHRRFLLRDASGPPLRVGPEFPPLATFHFGQAADLDASLYESATNDGVTAPELAGQFQECFPGEVSRSKDFAARHMAHAGERLSHHHASASESSTHRRRAASGLASQLLGGSSGQVLLDEVLDVRCFQYSGHVYDLQSPLGWLTASSIVVSNCRCSVIPLSLADAARHGVKEAAEWQRTGITPTFPEHVPDPGFAMPRGWTPVGMGLRSVL